MIDYGAVPDGKTNSTIAILKANAQCIRRGSGVISFPRGKFAFSPFAVAGSCVRVEGAGGGPDGTTLVPLSTTGDDITLTGQRCFVENIRIKPAFRKTDGYALAFKSGSFLSGFDRVWIDHGFNGILTENVAQLAGSRSHLRHMMGSTGIAFTGTNGSGSFGATFNDIVGDNPYPIPTSTTVKPWAVSAAFSAGDIILNNGQIYQCVQPGTSAGVGAGPNGLPAGTTPESAFTGTIADGSCLWRYVSSGMAWFLYGNFANSLRINNLALLNGFFGFLMDDAVNLGAASRPKWAHINNLECDHSFGDCVLLSKGVGVYATNSWWGSSLQGNGCNIGANFIGHTSVVTTRITGNWLSGYVLAAGPRHTIAKGSFIQHNSVAGSGAGSGLTAAAGATDFIWQGNQSGPDLSIGPTCNQAFGASVATGASDRYVIADNLVSGNVSGGVADGGTGTNKRVANNF